MTILILFQNKSNYQKLTDYYFLFDFWLCYFVFADPQTMQPQKAIDAIGKTLQMQYERLQPRVYIHFFLLSTLRLYLLWMKPNFTFQKQWHNFSLRFSTCVCVCVCVNLKARYKQCLDPTLEDVKKLCISLRRAAKEDRVLFHYNGHGVPKPTNNGEIWVFNKVRHGGDISHLSSLISNSISSLFFHFLASFKKKIKWIVQIWAELNWNVVFDWRDTHNIFPSLFMNFKVGSQHRQFMFLIVLLRVSSSNGSINSLNSGNKNKRFSFSPFVSYSH